MSKKMWNRIFKTKSTNKTPGISKKSSIQTPPTIINSSVVENRLSYYEEFHNCCQQQPPIKAKASRKQAALDSPVKTPSKFSKVVNTFTLKRNSKENQSNQLNTTTTTTTVETTASAGSENEKNYSTQGNVGGPIMDKIGTPTATILNQPDNTIADSADQVSLELIPCPTCSRTFVPRTLEKHIRICEKMNVRKRKIFDSSRQRREGTELAAYPLPKNFGLPPSKAERGLSPKPMQAPPQINSPRKPPEEMIKSNVTAKSRNPVASKKPPSPSPASTPTGHSTSAPRERTIAARVAPKRIQAPAAEQCPYCERCFGIKAYDRHVEWCKEKSLIAAIKQNSNNTQVAAKGRLEARTKYRAPCLKTKRSVNRDKYSCHTDENLDMQTSMEEYNQKTATMTSSMTSSFMSDGTKPPKGANPLKKTTNTSLKKPQPTHSEEVRPPVHTLNKTTVKTTLRRKRIEVFKSVSDESIGSAITTTQMSDGDLEELFEKEFVTKTAPMGIKMHADTQDLKITPRRRNKIEVSQASVHSKNSQSNRRRLIKERIEFFNSSPSASSSGSCRTGRVAPNEQVPGRLPSNKSFIVSGLSDNYDPFLSAKRQLEELCSPSSPTDGVFSPPNLTATSITPTKPSTPIIPNKMSTSLTSTTSLTNPRRVLTTVKSNFRRTSSLRVPRRSPLPMPSRPIFFPSTQKQRPTIQRGLSDEGPISSNFLKPEEYDEMPVRAVCVNDFAISNPQRVIRRDSNAAANRKNLRLQLPGAGQQQSNKDGTPTPPVGRGNNNILKTDSLAVFLKYENEAKAAENPVISSKELKDKSNTLSKQNSNKSVLFDEQSEIDRSEDARPRAETLPNAGGNLNTIKLEPIVRPIPFNQSGLVQPTKRQSPTVASPVVVPKPINLNLILDGRDHLGGAADCDYIDPKLINVCDNLSMDFGNDLPLSSNSSSSGGDRIDNETEKIDHAENSANLSSSSNSSPSPLTFKRATSPAPQIKPTPAINSNRSSGGDSRNLLKRKIRLGRNQFLYDASPENEPLDNDADDEGNNNRSSCEPNRFQFSQQTLLFPPTTYTSTTTTTATTNANIPNIPLFSPSTFDEFDFEEFLSSFDNDDEQFPSLFKDCREFLMNRSTLNKRSNTDKMSPYRSSNEKLNNSARKYEEDVEQNLNCGENKKRGEIFISIETDQNENDPHPKNDPLVAANPTAHIEEVDVNDNKFLKIQDDDVDEDDEEEQGHRSGGNHVVGEESEDRLRMRRIDLLNDFPNVRLNNAKNLIQQMHEDFQDLNATRAADAEDEINGNCIRQINGSSLYPVDSDEISSVECYPVRGAGSGSARGGGGRAVQSKNSADSAYGSLSRQSPTGELHHHHRGSNISNSRTRTPATPQESPQVSPFQYPPTPTYKYSNLNKNDSQKFRSRNFSVGSSSSGSENSLPPIKGNRNIPNLHQDNQSQMRDTKRPVHRSPMQSSALENKQFHNTSSRTTSSSTNILDRPSTPTSPSMKTSKFCHECGSRFLLDQAKFCMDCGVRRIVLK